MSANVAAGYVTVNSEQLAEARRNALNARDQMLKTRKRMNDALISAKRAEAAREEILASGDCKTYAQAGRAFVLIPRSEMMAQVEKDIKEQTLLRDQFKELDTRMNARLEKQADILLQVEAQVRAQVEAETKKAAHANTQ